MQQQTIRVGFIGLGKMGSGICTNLQRSGYPLTVYNRTLSKTEPFAQRGATVADDVKTLVEQSDMIFTSLLDDQSLLDLCYGENGILSAFGTGKIHVSLTTIHPSTADRLQLAHTQAGGHYLSAPVLGRPDVAETGKLIGIFAGNNAALQRVLPLAECYTAKQIAVGSQAGLANVLKIGVNYMVMTQLTMLGELYAYAEKSGLPAQYPLMAAKQFFAGNDAMIEYAEKIATRDFETVGFALSAGLKDVLIFDSAFTACGVQASAIQGAKNNLIAATAIGLGKQDWSALTEITRKLAGLDS